MKTTLVFVLLSVTLVFGVPIGDEDSQVNENGWYVPQPDGTLVWMSKEEAEKLEQQQAKGRSWFFGKLKAKFYLYSKENPKKPQELIIGDKKRLNESNFNSEKPTRFTIHGWQNNYNSEINVVVRDAFLDVMDCNVIAVDWDQRLSLNYIRSKWNVPDVGAQVAEMLDFLASETGMLLADVHLIGHSLGAHVAGFAGKNVKMGQINTIIGLDPAWPLYTFADCSNRLCDSDAFYVETVHTNGGLLGFLYPLGAADFYTNGGKLQPGCGLDIAGICSHLRAFHYYAEAIRENGHFKSEKCSNWEFAVKKSCNDKTDNIRMGGSDNFEIARGQYFTPVHRNYPYGA